MSEECLSVSKKWIDMKNLSPLQIFIMATVEEQEQEQILDVCDYTDSDFAKKFHVNEETISRAIEQLCKEGILFKNTYTKTRYLATKPFSLEDFEIKRQSSIVYRKDLNQIRKLFEEGKTAEAGMLAIALVEYAFCDQVSTDNKEINNYIFKNGVKGGIYGIYKNDELIYIGSTMRNFEDRWKEHRRNIEKKSNALYVYSLFDESDKIDFRILIDLNDLKSSKDLTRRDIECMELGLIDVFKPIGNIGGNSKPFLFR